jgi:hypothetical protein
LKNAIFPGIVLMSKRLRVANSADKWQKLLKLMDQTQISVLYRMTICLWSEENILNILAREHPERRLRRYFRKPLTDRCYRASYERRLWPRASSLIVEETLTLHRNNESYNFRAI